MMKAAGVSPTVVTFGCLSPRAGTLRYPRRETDADPAELAYALLSEMSERGRAQ